MTNDDKREYFKERYIKHRKEAKETYKKRKEYLSKETLREENVSGMSLADFVRRFQGGSKKQKAEGNAVDEPEVDIGSFSGDGVLSLPAEPKQYRFTSPFGPRWGRHHNGVDLAPLVPGASNGKILAAGDGVVIEAGSGVPGFGTWIVLKHKDDLYTVYGHMPPSTLKVKVGQQVKRGDHIANMGQEGASQGVHLHFEINKNMANRYKGSSLDPETVIDFRSNAANSSSLKARSLSSSFNAADDEDSNEDHHDDHEHAEYTGGLSEEGKYLDSIYSTSYSYNPVKFAGKNILNNTSLSRDSFLQARIGWGRTTNYSGYEKLDKKKFIHFSEFDGFEGNIYSPDAKEFFGNLLIATKKPYFKIISGFRFSNKGQLSPHEAGCAMDILVKDIAEAKEIADHAWLMGAKSIALGGDFDRGRGFIHIDIAPKGKSFSYGETPMYGGPNKWG